MHFSTRPYISPPTGYFVRAYICAAVFLLFLSGCSSTPDYPSAAPLPASQEARRGYASWYGPPYHGRKTSNGEIYDMYAFTAAHRTLPFNSRVRVKRLDSGEFVDVRINDRGPFVNDRVIDLSKGAAGKINMISKGIAYVQLIPLRIPPGKHGRWLIMIGGFRSRKEAFNFTSIMQNRSKKSRVVRGWHGDRNRYRVQLEGFRSRQRAINLKNLLKRKGYDAFLVRIG